MRVKCACACVVCVARKSIDRANMGGRAFCRRLHWRWHGSEGTKESSSSSRTSRICLPSTEQ